MNDELQKVVQFLEDLEQYHLFGILDTFGKKEILAILKSHLRELLKIFHEVQNSQATFPNDANIQFGIFSYPIVLPINFVYLGEASSNGNAYGNLCSSGQANTCYVWIHDEHSNVYSYNNAFGPNAKIGDSFTFSWSTAGKIYIEVNSAGGTFTPCRIDLWNTGSLSAKDIYNGTSNSGNHLAGIDFIQNKGAVWYPSNTFNPGDTVYWTTSTNCLGSQGQAGGNVFLTPSSVGNTTGKYFEVALVDVSVNKLKYCDNPANVSDPLLVVGASDTSIGTGYSNTLAMKANSNCSSGAANAADSFSKDSSRNGGYSDWFIPSKDELNAVISNVGNLIKLSSDQYWSSSEGSNSWEAWEQYITGPQNLRAKTDSYWVRLVRMYNP